MLVSRQSGAICIVIQFDACTTTGATTLCEMLDATATLTKSAARFIEKSVLEVYNLSGRRPDDCTPICFDQVCSNPILMIFVTMKV